MGVSVRRSAPHAFIASIIIVAFNRSMGIAELPKPRCHLFHLFYQVEIRLGSPPQLSSLFLLFFAAKY
jgi:hypothetical protein